MRAQESIVDARQRLLCVSTTTLVPARRCCDDSQCVYDFEIKTAKNTEKNIPRTEMADSFERRGKVNSMGSRRHATPENDTASTCVYARFHLSQLPPLRPRRTQLHEGYWPPKEIAPTAPGRAVCLGLLR